MIYRPVNDVLSSSQQKHLFPLSSLLISTVNPLVPYPGELKMEL